MASFSSFLSTKKFPSLKTFRALLRGPLTGLSMVVYALLISVFGAVFLLLVSLNNRILVTVPARGGNLTEGVIGAPHFINPILATTDTDKRLVSLVYGSLMMMDSNGTVSPSLAKSYTVSPDGKTYTMTLLPNLHFDDNKPLTSADVAFTVEKLQDAALSAQSAYWQPVSVATPDENTIIFTLPVEDSTFLSHLTFGILPKSIWQHINDQSFEYAKQNLLPVGAGPFKVSAVDYQNSIPATIVLARNNNAVGGTALLHTFTVTAVANSSDLLNALNDGDINFSYAVDPTTLTANSLYDGLNVQPVLNGQTVSIYRSSSDTVLASSAAVAELTTVIDKNALIAIVEHGYGTPAGVQSSTVTNTSLANLPSTGFSLAVENDPDLLLAAQTIARQLGQHGIAVSVKAYDQGTFQTAINTGAVSLFLARNTDLNIPSQYSVALPLYEQATPYIYTTDTHTIVPATLEYPDTQYGTVKDWYTNTDRLWKWFIRKE